MTEPAETSTRSERGLAEQLRQLWRQGQRPDVRQFLADAGAIDPALVLAVLRIDQRERWQIGERPRAEEYLELCPTLRADPAHAVELIRAEFLLQQERGESPAADEYLARFPEQAAHLREALASAAPPPSPHPLPPKGGEGGVRGAVEESPSTRDNPTANPGTLPTAGAPPFRMPTPLPALPGYDLVRELGKGGMGVVYQAFDRKRQKMVALKTMQGLDAGTLLRFKQEFRSLAGLTHPNLVTLYELIGDGSHWFFTMELIEGVHFLAHVRAARDEPSDRPTVLDTRIGPEAIRSGLRAGLTPPQVERLREALGQLAEGVNALHEAGKLHRDIKPGNVLVTPQGRVVLLDFGLAAELDRFQQHQSVHVLGTVAYMAPEQAARRPVSPASDWYAVGVMLYESLTGQLPFDGESYEVLLHKQQRDPPPPETLVADIPEDLAGLCRELLHRDPAARPSGGEVLRRLGPRTEATALRRPTQARSASEGTRPGLEVPLIGRQRHLRLLAEAFEDACRGNTVVVEVHGRSGAGKSALVQRFLDGLEEGTPTDGTAAEKVVVLRGRCYEQESVPYKALDSLVDSLCRYLERLPDAQVEALLPRDILTLARVFPVLRRVEAVGAAPRRILDISDPQEVRRRALSALRDLLARLGDRQPLVLAIDDLQWGDVDSAALLKDLLRPPDSPTLLLLVCYRSEDADSSPCLLALLKKPDAAGGAERGHSSAVGLPGFWRQLPVEPLTPEERRELALALLDPHDEARATRAEAIARQSGGYPFFVYELARYVQASASTPEPPPAMPVREGSAGDLTLSEVLWARILRLPEPARRVLEVVAVAGRPLAQADACRAADIGAAEPEALATLRAGRLLRSTGPAERNEIETYHDRIRETVAVHLDPATLRLHHARLAAVLEESGRADPEVLAVHLQGAGEAPRAGHHYALAAARAGEALAFDRAAKLYRLALQLQAAQGEEERRLRTHLADALANAGRGAEAARAYLAATAGADPAQALELQRRAALQFLSSGHVDDGLTTLRAVLAAVGLKLLPTPRRAFWALVWQRLRLAVRGLRFRRRAAEQIDPAELTRLDICHAASVGLSMVNTIQGAYFQTRSLLLALSAGEPLRLVSALATEAAHASIGGSFSRRRTERLLDAADALAREVGLPYPHAMVALARGIAAALAGRWRDGVALCDQAERIFRDSCTGVLWELGTAHRFALWPLMFMGEVVEINRRLPRLIKEARERDDLYAVTNLSLVIRTFARLAADEPGRARAELARVMETWSHQGYHVQHMNRMFDDAQIDLYEGDGEAAWRRVREHWPAIRGMHMLMIQQVRIFLRHLRARCALSAAGAAKDRTALLRAAEGDARALEREKVPWADALAKLLHAGVAARQGDRDRALQSLAAAVAGFTSADMPLYAAAARRCQGRLLGGDQGQELVRQADAWMTGQKVRNLDRMTAMLAPGFA